jgi:hypothetical protein
VARTPIWRRRLLAVGAAGITALALAACGSGTNPPAPAETTHTGDSFIGAAPSGAPSATSTGSGGGNNSGGGNGGGGNNTPTYPKDAKSYALAFLQALAQGDQNRLKSLGVNGAVAQVTDGFYNNLNANWAYQSCGPDPNNPSDANEIACVYINDNGDIMTVTMNKSQLGGAAAVLSALLDKTTYPSDISGYVTELFTAFQNGNANRVLRLGNSTVKGKLTCNLPEGVTPDASATPIDGQYSSFSIHGSSAGTSGLMYQFKVLTAPGGKAHAVADVLKKVC